MKRFILPLILAVVSGTAFADVPRKEPYTKYRELWDDSPFTTKPVITRDVVEDDVFEDYALAGVSPIKGGYRVTLIERKDPSKRTYVYSDEEQPSHGFKIVSVERDNDSPRDTVVHMISGSKRGTISYEEKLLTLAKPPSPKSTNQKQDQTRGRPRTLPAKVPGSNDAKTSSNQGRVSPRAPRPRVIGPPVNNQQKGQQGNNANPPGVGTRPTVRSR